MSNTGDPPLTELLDQERQLVFHEFTHDTAWQVGVMLRNNASRAQLPVAVSIRRGAQCLFHAALPGSSVDNDGWLVRKAAVVHRYGHSSYYIGCKFRAEGLDFDIDSRLDRAQYAAHGGAFPLLLRGTGCIGSVAVSGLPQQEDHQFLVTELLNFLAQRP